MTGRSTEREGRADGHRRMTGAHIGVIIPALNEEQSLPKVLAEIPSALRAEVVVVDNGSTDATAEVATAAGARVVREPVRGYGAACLRGIAALPRADILVFLDGDHSDYPEQMEELTAPILEGSADLVIGSRLRGTRERNALPPHSVFGNWLASHLLRLLYGQRVTDLGPFRAVRAEALHALGMQDRGYGWTVEMQIKAARTGLRVVEVPVNYRRRIGRSKITGSLRASLHAGAVILCTIARYACRPTGGELHRRIAANPEAQRRTE